MKPSNVVASLFLALGLGVTAHAQWISLPLPGTPRTADGKPNLSAPAPRTADNHPDLTGMWRATREPSNPNGRGLEAYMPAGSKAPLTPAGEKVYADNTGNGKWDVKDPSERCLPDGIPNQMRTFSMKIVQTPNLIVELMEEFWVFRQIHTDGRKPPVDPDPSWWGYSIARWEKDTLVVETSGFNEQTFLDGEGLPHSSEMSVIERYTRSNYGNMAIEFTFTDPKYYSRPWNATFQYNIMPDTELIEHFCENEKDSGGDLLRK